MINSEDYSFVTCIYDIGRLASDGRSVNDYAIWLSNTLKIFPNTYIFYEDENLKSVVNAGHNWVNMPFSRFKLASLEIEISSICKEMAINSNDLTFKLPKYGILQFQKFSLLKLVSSLNPNDNGFFWIDAGISRFLNFDYSVGTESMPFKIDLEILKMGASLFEVSLQNNLNWKGRLLEVKTGTSRRTFSGTSFFVCSKDVDNYEKMLNETAIKWVGLNQWDNEQVALNQLFHSGAISPRILRQRNGPGSVARAFLGLEKPDYIEIGSNSYRRLRKSLFG